PSETDISSSLAPATGPTAAIALPPQIAVPTEINSALTRSTFNQRPSATPMIIVAEMPSAVYPKPELPARKTSRRFIPNPSPTTLACSNVFESDLVCLAYGFEKPSPNPKPSASAIGGDLKITVNKSSRKKTSLESIRASIRIASQACLTTRLVGLMGLIGLIKTCGSYRSHKSYKSHSFLIRFRLGFKRELLVRVPQLIPGDAFFAVGGFAPEDGHERAFDAVLGVVAVFVFALALAEHAVDEGQRLLVVMFVITAFVLVDHRRFAAEPRLGAFDAHAAGAAFAGS